ncbi:MAG: hypothetical protein QXW73_00965 [Nitrososphaerales archaeon]
MSYLYTFLAIAMMIMITITNSFTNASWFLSVEAQGLQLRVSAAERPQFQNHFFGPQIVQVVIDDPGATDPDESTVGLQVKGTTVPRVHLQDGLWYHYFAEENTFGIFMDVMTDGIRDNRISVISAGPADANHPSPITIGTTSYTIVFGTGTATGNTFVREITRIGGTGPVFVEVAQDLIFPTLPRPFQAANALNDNVVLGDGGNDIAVGAGACIVQSDQVFATCDWPFIRLTGINELDIVGIRAGSASVNLTYDDFNESISSRIDRSAAYPIDAEVIVSYSDFMWNINPVEEDVVSFVLDKTNGNPTSVIYRFTRSYTPAFATDLLPILFRPNLNFDTRQILEVDVEGLNSLRFYEQFDSATGSIIPVIGGMRVSENARPVFAPEFAPLNKFPVITMIESDPNTSFFESLDEQEGSRSTIFTGLNDRVANFDYFDIINSASMTSHDGFTTVDKEFYDSADRAVFTVTDADLNLRSRVSEQPPARESRTFVKVGNPFPLSNNPALAKLFPTSDPNRHTLKNLFPITGFTFDTDSIEVAAFFLVNDITADVTANPNIRGIINFAGGDTAATRNGIASAINDFFINTDDIVSASPSDSELIALQFNNPDMVPAGVFDKASGILINTSIRLQDLYSFERFSLTRGQILRDATAPSGSTPGSIQAFDIDPFLSAVSIYRTTGVAPATVTDLTSLAGNPMVDVFFPRYNLMQVDLAGFNIGMEDVSGDRLNSVALQVEAFRDLDQNGKLSTLAELATSRRTMVDFNPFQASDTDGDGIRTITNLASTRIGVGSFRVVDLMNFDWDGDGSTIFEGDVDDLRTTSDGPILLRVSGVFTDNNVPAEPVEVLERGSQIAVIDFGGIGSVVTQDPDGLGKIDQIRLNAFENMVYRIQVKEQGSNSNVFTGRMDFMTANQFDTAQRVLGDIVLQGDPARAWLANRFIPPNRLAFSYSDIDIVRSFRAVSVTFIYETSDGKVSWDSKTYKFGSRAIITLEDQDLNRRPDAVERYDLPLAGFIFFELGKKRVDDTCTAAANACFLRQIDATLMETGPNTGIFQAQIQMPPTIRLKDGTVAPTRQDDLEINYIDVRDRSSITQEFDDITNIRTSLGQVLLDRDVYPQGPRLPPNQPLLGAIMYISIVEGAVNVDPEVREAFDLTSTVNFSSVTGDPNDIRDVFEIKIFNGGGSDPIIYSANPASSILAGGKAFPILDRNGNEVTKALETGPNTSTFELEFMVYCPDSTPLQPFLSKSVCVDTIFDDFTGALGLPPILTFKPNSPIMVTFNDPADDSGVPRDVNAHAVIQGVTAQIGTDKMEYDVGDPITFFMIEPDFNFDSRAVEQVDFNVVGVTTDKTPFDEVPLQILLNALHAFGSFSSTEAGFRESDVNSGIFGAIGKPGLLDTLVANRGSKIELVYRDNTPSGGGNPIRIEHNILLKANMPEIIFDKEEYTPFDEVFISIISPDSNVDPFKIDTIAPLISTSSESGFRLKMNEIGPDGRIFEKDITLTPDKSKFPGDILAKREDGLTVEFRIDSKTVVAKSVFINYHIGNIMFDRDLFRINDRGIVRVIDPDENKNPFAIDTVSVRLWSTTDRGGMFMILRETGDRTGIFEEFITFTTDEESSGSRLRVSNGDTITAKYTDRTLPPPAALDADGVFTVEVEELFASALFGSRGPPIERVAVTDPLLVDQKGQPLEEAKIHDNILIKSQIANDRNIGQKFAYIVQVKDSDGITISLSWISGVLYAGDSIAAAQAWIPTNKGKHYIEVFVWESLDNPVALSPVRSTYIMVS